MTSLPSYAIGHVPVKAGAERIDVDVTAEVKLATVAGASRPERFVVLDTRYHAPSLDTANVDSHSPFGHIPPVSVREARNVAGAEDVGVLIGPGATVGSALDRAGAVPADVQPASTATAPAATRATTFMPASMRRGAAHDSLDRRGGAGSGRPNR